MKFNQILNNFSSGEWGPKMRARTDVQQYLNACEKLKNFIPQVQGGAFLRSGTRTIPVSAPYDGFLSADTELIPWNTSTKSLIIIAQPGPTVSHWSIYNTVTETFTAIGAGTVFIPTDVSTLRWVALGDTIQFVFSDGSSYPFLLYDNAGTYTVSSLETYVGGRTGMGRHQYTPYRPLEANGSSVTLTLDFATVGTGRTMTASAAYFLGTASDIGSYFILGNATSTGAVRITNFVSTTVCTVEVYKALPIVGPFGSVAGTFWQESSWSIRRGWPRTITAFQGRVVYGGNTEQPDTLWGSRIGNYYDMLEIPFTQDPLYTSYATLNSRPFALTPTAADALEITGLSSAKTLLINTNKAEIVAYGTQTALGPNDVSFESSTSFGAAKVQPVRVNNYLTFVEIGGTKVRDIVFNFDENQYKSSDLSFVAEHLIMKSPIANEATSGAVSAITKLASTKRTNLLWANTNNWDLAGVTLDRDYQVNGWFDFLFGDEAVVTRIGTGGVSGDKLFMIVRRTLGDGTYSWCFEELTQIWEADHFYISAADQYYDIPTYLDGHIKYTAVTAKKTWGPYAHFRGQEVSVIADGFYLGEFEVSDDASAEVTLPDNVNAVIAGIRYDNVSKIKVMPIEIGQQVPTSAIGSLKRIDEVTVKFWNTIGAKYGRKEDDLFSISTSDPTLAVGTPQVPFTGYKTVKFAGTYDAEAQVVVAPAGPWPCNVLGIASKGMTNE